jgi:hypothetical protein
VGVDVGRDLLRELGEQVVGHQRLLRAGFDPFWGQSVAGVDRAPADRLAID